MSQADGSIIIDTKIDQAGFDTGLKKLMGDAEAGSKAVGVAVAAIGAGIALAVSSAAEDKQANLRIENIAASMGLWGDQASVVTDRLQALAGEQARQIGVDDGVIKNTQAKLLTFAELAATADEVGGAFDRATVAAVDMAAAGFGDAESNAVQLGKALNNPIAGVTALTRSGITFTEAEKDMLKAMVETGDMAGAQAYMLEAIERQVGGTAAATASAGDRMRVAFGEAVETLGGLLLPVVEKLQAWLADKALPAVEAFVGGLADIDGDQAARTFTIIGGAILAALVPALWGAATAAWAAVAPLLPFIAAGAAIGALVAYVVDKLGGWQATMEILREGWANFTGGLAEKIAPIREALAQLWDNLEPLRTRLKESFEGMAPTLERFKEIWADLQPIFEAVGVVIGAVAAVVAGVLAGALNGIMGAVDGIVAAFQGVVGFISGLVDWFKALFSGDWAGLEAANTKMRDSIVGVFAGLWDAIKGFLEGFVTGVVDFFTGLYDTLVGHSIVPDMINGIVAWFLGLPEQVAAILSTFVTNVTTAFLQVAQTAIDQAGRLVGGVIDALRRSPIFGPLLDGIAGAIGALTGMATSAATAGRELVAGIWTGITDKFQWLVDRVRGFASDVTDKLKAFFGISSPSKLFEEEIGVNLALGVGKGFTRQVGAVVADMSRSVRSEMGRFTMQAPVPAQAASISNQDNRRTVVFQQPVRTYSEVLRAMDDIERGLVVG